MVRETLMSSSQTTSNKQTKSNHSTLDAQQTTPELQTQSENELSHEEQTTPNGETLPEQQTSSGQHATSEQQTSSVQHATSEQQTSCVQQTSSEQQTTTRSSNTTYSFEPMMTIIDKIADGQRVPPQTTMKYEMLRFCTLRSFPKGNKPYITRLAGAGFYYANEGDEVVCYCCARRRRNWTEFENPLEVHRELNPNCSFLIRNSEVNVSVRQSIESSSAESHSNLSTINRDQSNSNFRNELTEVNVSSAVETGSQIQTNQNSEHSSFASNAISRGGNQSISLLPVDVPQTTIENQSSNNSTGSGSSSVAPKYPNYVSKTTRLSSFNDCGDIVIPPDRLAQAGFFYAGFGDCVRCFQCGVGTLFRIKN
ncbi:baculoviral IAP repeat-containing protein 3-like [Ruditapes philippinarum]|uniref:baculoviral IAP repeat-containing protein 3-like n=1 Tax=Ruditapes philippinarum TaxID=129788 RepID=UPI00295AD4CB|nr:baculoviral IAP repeat-containing protein 3-like [Ruditapes philippinarum]